MSTILECKNLSKKYGRKQALDNITLSLESGKIIGLLGPNGSGKTTLIKLINGLLAPTGGKLFINGNTPGVESKKIVSYLPERTYLDETQKVSEAITLFEDFYKDFDRSRAISMLEKLNIDSNARIKTLSKGTKEKVQLILVMSRRAKLYCLDEPIAGVDPAARDYILSTIINNYEPDSTILISTHLISDVENILDEVVLLIFALVIVISSIAIFTYIYSGYHFYKNVFTDQGYLTNTLPVTPSQLLLSKELAALLWLLIDVVVISISIFILVGSTELFSNFSIFWRTLMRYASQTPLFTTLVIIALVLAPFLLIGILFFSITLGNLASSHKVLASIGAYVGIYVVQQIFGLIQLVVWGYFGSTTIMRVNIYSNNYSFGTFLNPILITGLIFNIILIAVCWMGSKYIMTKRLNLQ